MLAACTHARTGPPLENGWAPAGACHFLGNRADRMYCATTGAQLLANPSVYDGHLIQLSGWVVAGDGKAALYLTKDSRESSQTFSLISLYGPAVPDIAAFATERQSLDKPVSLQVSGRFHLHGLSANGVRSKQVGENRYRFGRLEEIEEWGP